MNIYISNTMNTASLPNMKPKRTLPGEHKKNNKVDKDSKQIKALHHDLQLSKVGLEAISNFQQDQRLYSEQFQRLQEELQGVILQITNQSQKKVLFEELIEILKFQMSVIKQYETEKIERQKGKISHKVKELKVEIDRICQKRNQQVANIRQLRELASAARGQRVIFSNLFKKIQKEIKQNQEKYKQQIIELQKARLQLAEFKGNVEADFENLVDEDSECHLKTQISSSEPSCFIDHQLRIKTNDSKYYRTSKSKHSYAPKQKRSENSRYEHRQKERTQEDMTIIDKLQRFCEEIRIRTGSRDTNEMIHKFSTLPQQNESLFQEIDQMENQTQDLLKQIQTQKKNQKALKDMTELNSQQQKNFSKIQKDSHESQELLSNQLVLEEVCRILAINPIRKDSSCEQLSLEQKSQMIDRVIQSGNLREIRGRQNNWREGGGQLDVVFQRMEIFSQCQKLMDKQSFMYEYSKEISKKGKAKLRKN